MVRASIRLLMHPVVLMEMRIYLTYSPVLVEVEVMNAKVVAEVVPLRLYPRVRLL